MNRHARGAAAEIKATVPYIVAVKQGDLMFLNQTAGYVGAHLPGKRAAADNLAYPWMAGISNTAASDNFPDLFLGVAMDDSPYGSTDTISIATGGIFKFPLNQKSSVTIGAVVSAVSPVVEWDQDQLGAVTSNYTVAFGGFVSGSGASLGYAVETTSGSSTVWVQIRTKFGPAGRPVAGDW